jgi:hypothetical protein
VRPRAGAERFADRRTARPVAFAIFERRGLVVIVEVAERVGFVGGFVPASLSSADPFTEGLAFPGACSGTRGSARSTERLLFLFRDSEAADSAAPIVRADRHSSSPRVVNARGRRRVPRIALKSRFARGTVEITKSTPILNL